MIHVMRKPASGICKNKGADQLHGKLLKSKHIDSFKPFASCLSYEYLNIQTDLQVCYA